MVDNIDDQGLPSTAASTNSLTCSSAIHSTSSPIKLRIELTKLQEIINRSSFQNNGDSVEKSYYSTLRLFPNCELFWKNFVVPSTKRIDLSLGKLEPIRNRDSISIDIIDIGMVHYSMFVNLVYAHAALDNKHLSFFEDFYLHLVSACDLAESLLLKLFLLNLECAGSKSKILNGLTKEDFLKLCEAWFDKNYSQLYEHYFKKGKGIPINIPHLKDILDEYLSSDRDWKEFKKFSHLLRQYRNIVAHNVQIGKIVITGIHYIPKKEKVLNYQRMKDVIEATKDIKTIATDFQQQELQMKEDLDQLEKLLNSIWSEQVENIKSLFAKKNTVLLNKFLIEIT